MAFIVPAPKSKKSANRFTFTLPGETEERSLPRLTHLRADHKRRLAEVALRMRDEATQTEAALEGEILMGDIMEEECPGLLELLTSDQQEALIAAWQEASGTTVGESSAS